MSTAATTITADAAGARGARFDVKWLVIGACVALTLYIAVVPLGFLLWQSFFTPQSAAKAAVSSR